MLPGEAARVDGGCCFLIYWGRGERGRPPSFPPIPLPLLPLPRAKAASLQPNPPSKKAFFLSHSNKAQEAEAAFLCMLPLWEGGATATPQRSILLHLSTVFSASLFQAGKIFYNSYCIATAEK